MLIVESFEADQTKATKRKDVLARPPELRQKPPTTAEKGVLITHNQCKVHVLIAYLLAWGRELQVFIKMY